MEILVISGSLRTNSYNTALLKSAVTLVPANAKIALFNAMGDMPHFNPDIHQRR